MKARTKTTSKVVATVLAIGVVSAILEAMPFGERNDKGKNE